MSGVVVPFSVPGKLPAGPASVRRAHGLQRLLGLVATWMARNRERRRFAIELAAMPDHTLADFRLTRDEARAAVTKPFWRA